MAGHNNIEKYAKDYLQRVRKFIDHVDQWVEEKNALALQEEQDYLGEQGIETNLSGKHLLSSPGTEDNYVNHNQIGLAIAPGDY
jgi:hypothetical protein